jgi:hypothetical protein
MKRSKARSISLQRALAPVKRQGSFLPAVAVKEALELEASKPMRAACLQRGVAFESLFGEASQQESLF